MVDAQARMQSRARAALHTMLGPEHLGAVGQRDSLERLLARMRRRERGMAARMPVLGQDHIRESGRERIDDRHHGVALGHGQGAAGAEIVLHIDDDQDAVRAHRWPQTNTRSMPPAFACAT